MRTPAALRARMQSARALRVPFARYTRHAAVAAIFRPGEDGLELLFVQRATRRGDRWSGDLAFPGGMAEPSDAGTQQTASRETLEEVGLVLPPPVGRLSDALSVQPRRIRPMVIAPWVYLVPANAQITPAPREIADFTWVPFAHFHRSNRVRIPKRIAGLSLRVPAYPIGDHVLWGLTLSLVDQLRRRA